MKNKELKSLIDGIPLIANLKLGGKISLAIAKNNKKLADANTIFVDAHKKLLEQYCIRDEKDVPVMKPAPFGGQDVYTFTDENLALLQKEYEKIADADSEVVLEKINMACIEQFSDVTPEQVSVLLLMAE